MFRAKFEGNAVSGRGEVVDGLVLRDDVSQLTHVIGGICGALLGLSMQK